MQWDDLLGHELQKEWFRTAIRGRRLGTSFLFVGPEGIGKRTFARLLAKSLLCRNSQASDLAPCGQCEDCVQVDAATHPDLIAISKPADKAYIPLELLIGEADKRMRQGLCHDIYMRPYGGRRKVAIVDDADHFNTEGANCLLKTLEEPPSDSVLILIGTSLQRQLPTIRSRCQAILFRPLSDDQLQRLLLRNGLVDSQDNAQLLSSRCGGSLAEARLLSDPDVNEFRSCLLERICGPRLPMIELSKTCGTMIDSAGKDARVKRERAKLIFRISAAFYRELSLILHALETGEPHAHQPPMDDELKRALETSSQFWMTGSPGATAAWNRCLQAMEQVDRNANQATLLESWSADLARLSGC